MPTYEYRCPKCGHQFEVFERKMTDRSTRKCPECGGRAKRLISGGAGLVFKGSGFYITDYKNAGSKGKKDGDGGSEKKDDGEAPQKKTDKSADGD